MKTTNPALKTTAFQNVYAGSSTDAMSIQGAINKTFVLLGILVLSAAWIWGKINAAMPSGVGLESQAQPQVPSIAIGAMMFGGIAGFILALVTVFKKEWSSITSPLYALCEGLLLGGISAFFEMQYPGIVTQAVMLTFATMGCLLMLYKSGVIKVNDKFRAGVFAATGAICVVYLINFVMGFFGHQIGVIYSSSTFGIIFSLIVVGVAALNLVLDFDVINRSAQMGLPKYMEWYCAFALMVTLIWLYIEILRLLAKLRDRR